MRHRSEQQGNKRFYQKAWFMWVFLIIFPPVGIFLLWKQKIFKKPTRFILTTVGVLYFASPFFLVANTTIPLFYNHEEFVEAYQAEAKEVDVPFELKQAEETDHSITSKLSEDLTIIENKDDAGQIHEVVLVGQGEGSDIVLAMGLTIGLANEDQSIDEVKEIMNELKLFDENYDFENNETTVERDTIRYNMKYKQSEGLLLTVSKVN
ncbi:hypothetical protein [Pseudalkalibacillus hwajinpoensis]|uniref:hypothetical protein n=1 Tax=Guptibacillus hwajinpoensis TaxID=208199 RepID=UPI001CD2448F|nr:hypothetical protein [Pseudalkalibacillus hwajinpoensis]MCA0993493.1 hypothetical protein [Pseudalkalibacillus hwajinpoensis]